MTNSTQLIEQPTEPKPKGLFIDLIAAQGPEFVAEMAAIKIEPAPSTAGERAAFEAWLRSKWTPGYACPKTNDGKYEHGEAQRFWECWQAAALLQSHALPDHPEQHLDMVDAEKMLSEDRPSPVAQPVQVSEQYVGRGMHGTDVVSHSVQTPERNENWPRCYDCPSLGRCGDAKQCLDDPTPEQYEYPPKPITAKPTPLAQPVNAGLVATLERISTLPGISSAGLYARRALADYKALSTARAKQAQKGEE